MADNQGSAYEVPGFVKERTRTVVINMFGGPGSGKTTAAHEFVAELKKRGYVTEYAGEFAKELVWTLGDKSADPSIRAYAESLLDGSFKSQKQLYSEQKSRIDRLIGQCDFVVTDSPIALSSIYLKPANRNEQHSMDRMVLADMADNENFNVFVKRAGAYESEGRIHDAAEAREIDRSLRGFLSANGIRYGTYDHKRIASAIDNAVRFFHAVNEGKPRIDDIPAPPERTAEQERDFVNVKVPKTGYRGAALLSAVKGAKDGSQRYKLPPHMPSVSTEGGPVDLSGYTMTVYAWQVKEFDNDPGYYDIAFPRINSEGKPWEVVLTKWVKVGEDKAAGVEGSWESVRAKVKAADLVGPMRDYRDERRAYARARAQEKEGPAPEKGPEAESAGAPAEQPKAPVPAGPGIAVPEPARPVQAMPSVSRDLVMAAESAAAQRGAVAMRAQAQAR